MKEKTRTTEILNLEAEIREANEAYLRGAPIMTDDQFDTLVEMLKKINPESPLLKEVGGLESSSVVPLPSRMLSLDKALTTKALLTWISKNTNYALEKEAKITGSEFEQFVVTPKYDGMSAYARFEDGVLKEAISRGDGRAGSSLTHKFKHVLGNIDAPKGSVIELRGELVISKANFERLNALQEASSFKYSNPRNAVVSLFLSKETDHSKLALVDFIPFELLNTSNMFYSEDLEDLKSLGLEVHSWSKAVHNNIKQIVSTWNKDRDSFEYVIDGLVFRTNSNSYYKRLGDTITHPKGAVAYKFKPEACSTVIKSIEWSLGKKHVTPVAVFEPILVNGATLSRASFQSTQNFIKLGALSGDEIIVERAGDVIPHIRGKKTAPHSEVKMLKELPTTCPACGVPLKLLPSKAMLYCPNHYCYGKFAKRLENFCKALEIPFIGPKNAYKISKKFYSFVEFITATRGALKATGIGNFIADKVYDSLQDLCKEDHKIPLGTFIFSLGIETVATSTSEEIASKGKNLHEIFDLVDRGELSPLLRRKASGLEEALKERKEEILQLAHFLHIEDHTSQNLLKDRRFLITGKLAITRKELIAIINKNGGRYSSGAVANSTDVLIQNDPSSNTTKSRKAKEVGAMVITEVQLESIIKEGGF